MECGSFFECGSLFLASMKTSIIDSEIIDINRVTEGLA
jgi:hypothetical protein